VLLYKKEAPVCIKQGKWPRSVNTRHHGNASRSWTKYFKRLQFWTLIDLKSIPVFFYF